MKTEFTTFEIAKALGIPRGRLREWIEGGFIKPSKSAEGQGTKSLFSKSDIYSLVLFGKFIDYGIDRKVAGNLLAELIAEGGMNNTGRLIITKRGRGKYQEITHGFLSSGFEPVKNLTGEYIVIPFGDLKKEIDAALSVHEQNWR